MKTNKTRLQDTLNSILNGNREEAEQFFTEYLNSKTVRMMSENYGDSYFEKEIAEFVTNTEEYYRHAIRLKQGGADYSDWEALVLKVSEEQGIYPEDEDDVYDAYQNLMRSELFDRG